MKYEKDMMASWDEYAIKETLLEQGREEGKAEVVRNLLSSGNFSISEIANLANVTEAFVQRIKKEINKKK